MFPQTVLSLFLLVLVLSLCLLVLLLVLCLKTLLASFFGVSLQIPILRLVFLFLLFLRLLPLPVVSSSSSSSSSSRPRSSVRAHGVRGAAASWAFHRILCLLSWRPLPNLRPLSLLLSISLTFNFLPLRVSVWVRWWLRVQWYNGLFYF